MEIPRHKLTAVWSKSTPNSMTIACQLSSRFYLFPMLEHDMDFGQVQLMEFQMTFATKMMGFPMRIWSHFPPNCRQKDMRKSMSHFLQGSLKILVTKLS